MLESRTVRARSEPHLLLRSIGTVRSLRIERVSPAPAVRCWEGLCGSFPVRIPAIAGRCRPDPNQNAEPIPWFRSRPVAPAGERPSAFPYDRLVHGRQREAEAAGCDRDDPPAFSGSGGESPPFHPASAAARGTGKMPVPATPRTAWRISPIECPAGSPVEGIRPRRDHGDFDKTGYGTGAGCRGSTRIIPSRPGPAPPAAASRTCPTAVSPAPRARRRVPVTRHSRPSGGACWPS